MSTEINADYPVVCTVCLVQDHPKMVSKANAGAGCALMLLFIVPGLVYFIVNSGQKAMCKACGSPDVVPLDSPRAKQMGVYRARSEEDVDPDPDSGGMY